GPAAAVRALRVERECRPGDSLHGPERALKTLKTIRCCPIVPVAPDSARAGRDVFACGSHHAHRRGVIERHAISADLGAFDGHHVPTVEAEERRVGVGAVTVLCGKTQPAFGSAAHEARAPLALELL